MTPKINDNSKQSNNHQHQVANQSITRVPAGGLNGTWRDNKHIQLRGEMIRKILITLSVKDKNASPEWIRKLPMLSKKLEVLLYRSAPSLEAYLDITTLKHRMTELARDALGKQNDDGKKLVRSRCIRNETRRKNPTLRYQGQQHSQPVNDASSNGENLATVPTRPTIRIHNDDVGSVEFNEKQDVIMPPNFQNE